MKLINRQQTQAKLGNMSRSALYFAMENGLIPMPIKIAGKLLWDENEIDAFLRLKFKERAEDAA